MGRGLLLLACVPAFLLAGCSDGDPPGDPNFPKFSDGLVREVQTSESSSQIWIVFNHLGGPCLTMSDYTWFSWSRVDPPHEWREDGTPGEPLTQWCIGQTGAFAGSVAVYCAYYTQSGEFAGTVGREPGQPGRDPYDSCKIGS